MFLTCRETATTRAVILALPSFTERRFETQRKHRCDPA